MRLVAGFIAAVCVLIMADHVAGTNAALPFALTVFGLAVLFGLLDGHRR